MEVPEGNAELPNNVATFTAHQLPDLMDTPDYFAGRDSELRSLEDMVNQAMPPPRKRWTPDAAKDLHTPGRAPVGRMYISAPGAGKSSIMAELQRRLEKRDISVISVKPHDIFSPSAFRKVIEEQPPWSDRKAMQEVRQAFAMGLAEGADRVAGAETGGYAVLHGVPVAVEELKLARTTLDAWLKGDPPNTGDMLRLLQYGKPGGCVLIIDEAQDMREFLDNEEYRNHLHTIIEYLGVPSSRKKFGIERATVLLAGLPDTPTVVAKIGARGVKPVVVAPLEPEAVREVMEHAIRKGAGSNRELAKAAEALWSESLVEGYGDWTRNAQAGAQAVEMLVQRYGNELLTAPWRWSAIRKLGDRFRWYAFDHIIQRARGEGESEGIQDELVDTVAIALIRNGNRISQTQLIDTVERAIRTFQYRGMGDDAQAVATEAQRVVSRLLRSGMLDRTDCLPANEDRQPFAYYCPIPSLLNEAAGAPSVEDDEVAEILRDSKLQYGEPTPEHERFRPTWPSEDNGSAEVG